MEESLPMAINIGLHACQVEALPAHDRHRPPQTRSPRGECRYMRQSGGMPRDGDGCCAGVMHVLKHSMPNIKQATSFNEPLWRLLLMSITVPVPKHSR